MNLEPRYKRPYRQMQESYHQHDFGAKALSWLFRAGFAGVFLVNAAIALLDPSGFVELMRSSFLGTFVSNFTPFVWLIAANDLLLGILLIWDRWSRYVRAWAGIWLLVVTLIKVSELLR